MSTRSSRSRAARRTGRAQRRRRARADQLVRFTGLVDRWEETRLMRSHRRYSYLRADAASSALTYAFLLALGPALLLMVFLTDTASLFLIPIFGFDAVRAADQLATAALDAVLGALPVGGSEAKGAIAGLPGPVTEGAAVLALYAALAVFRTGRAVLRELFGQPAAPMSPLRAVAEDLRDGVGLAAVLLAATGLGLSVSNVAGVPALVTSWLVVSAALAWLYLTIPRPDRRVPARARVAAAAAGGAAFVAVGGLVVAYTDAVAANRDLVYGTLTVLVAVGVGLNLALRLVLRLLCYSLEPHLPTIPAGGPHTRPTADMLVPTRDGTSMSGPRLLVAVDVPADADAADVATTAAALGRQHDTDVDTVWLLSPDVSSEAAAAVSAAAGDARARVDTLPAPDGDRTGDRTGWGLLRAVEAAAAAGEATHVLLTVAGCRPRRTWVLEGRSAFARGYQVLAGREVLLVDELPKPLARYGRPLFTRVRGWLRARAGRPGGVGSWRVRRSASPANLGVASDLLTVPLPQPRAGGWGPAAVEAALDCWWRAGAASTRAEMFRVEVPRRLQ